MAHKYNIIYRREGKILSLIILIIYVICGYQSYRYIRRTLFGIKVEVTASLLNYVWNGILWGLVLGWLTIPLAGIVWLFHRK